VTPAEWEKIQHAAEEIAAGLPPLTAAQRDRLRALLTAARGDAPARARAAQARAQAGAPAGGGGAS
jgi:hypothetical protein